MSKPSHFNGIFRPDWGVAPSHAPPFLDWSGQPPFSIAEDVAAAFERAWNQPAPAPCGSRARPHLGTPGTYCLTCGERIPLHAAAPGR